MTLSTPVFLIISLAMWKRTFFCMKVSYLFSTIAQGLLPISFRRTSSVKKRLKISGEIISSPVSSSSSLEDVPPEDFFLYLSEKTVKAREDKYHPGQRRNYGLMGGRVFEGFSFRAIGFNEDRIKCFPQFTYIVECYCRELAVFNGFADPYRIICGIIIVSVLCEQPYRVPERIFLLLW